MESIPYCAAWCDCMLHNGRKQNGQSYNGYLLQIFSFVCIRGSIDIVGHSHIDSKVDYEIEIKMEKKSNIVEIVLPQYLPINNWSIEEKEYVNLISYNKTDFPIKDGDMIEGISTAVQKFKIQVSTDETTEILLKWANINEVDKLFKDKKEDYLLKISVSYY